MRFKRLKPLSMMSWKSCLDLGIGIVFKKDFAGFRVDAQGRAIGRFGDARGRRSRSAACRANETKNKKNRNQRFHDHYSKPGKVVETFEHTRQVRRCQCVWGLGRTRQSMRRSVRHSRDTSASERRGKARAQAQPDRTWARVGWAGSPLGRGRGGTGQKPSLARALGSDCQSLAVRTCRSR